MFAINSIVDSIVTKLLKKYLTMGTSGGKKYSDVVIHDGNLVIDELVGRPRMMDELLRDRKIPMRCISLYIRKVFVRLPWNNWSTGYVEIDIDQLTLVLQPVGPEDLTVEQVRAAKEALIMRATATFLKQQQKAMKADQDHKPGLVRPAVRILPDVCTYVCATYPSVLRRGSSSGFARKLSSRSDRRSRSAICTCGTSRP